MKDHYTLLHNFLEKHFPAQLPKLEAIKDKPVEVIMMYNMYKRSAKNALKERVVSDNESPSLKAKIAADDFMQHYRKTYRTVNSNFGTEAGEEFKKIVKAKFNSMSEELEEATINETEVEYKVAGRPVTLNRGEKSDGTDWTVTFKNGKTTALADVLALIKPEPELTMNEAKATCCHRCGRVHVKGSGCKKPYLKGKDSCAINEIETLKEFYNK